MKNWILKLREKLSRAPWLQKVLQRTKLPTSLEPLALADWLHQSLQRQDPGFLAPFLTILISSFFWANLAGLWIENWIPESLPTHARRSFQKIGSQLEDYQIVFTRNLFNSKGVIPGDEITPGGQDLGGIPIKSTLPLNLIGTLVLKDELKSIATIEDKAVSQVFPVRIQDEIPGKARILTIESRKVIFVNISTGRREYLELPEDLQIVNPRITLGATPNSKPGIEKISPTQYNISRSEVDKTLSDLNRVLTEARAIPNFENGQPAGYKLFQIIPGSIYDKLGLKNGDTLCGLNGDSINDPGKAFELLNELKTSNHLELCVKRDGKQSTFAYDIR